MKRKLINDNINTVLKILFNKFKLKYSTRIMGEMREHPDFPSFLAINHVLKQEGINCLALKTTIESLRDELPKPVLVNLATNINIYYLVNQVDNTNVHIINESGDIDLEPIERFTNFWDGNAMIFDSENVIPRKISFQKKVLLGIDKLRIPFLIIVLLFLLTFLLLRNIELRSTFNYLYQLLSVIGLLFSLMLVIGNFDEHNSLVLKFCKSKNTDNGNCSFVHHSKDAYFLGIFLWSDIGFVYFSFMMLLNLIIPNGLSPTITGILSTLAFPYVFYSITFQKFVARSWCRLCLGVQGVITAMFVVSLLQQFSDDLRPIWSIEGLISVFLLFLTTSAAYIILKSLIAKILAIKGIASNYLSLKHDVEVKKLLFKKQHKVTSVAECCLTLGNPNGKTRISLVISPVCNPCINELRELLPILKSKENTRVEVIFLIGRREDDPLAFQLAKILTSKYLTNANDFLDVLWNYVDNYPYSKFRQNGYIGVDTNDTPENILIEQINWCIANRLYSTPSVLINGRLLPFYYSVKEIDYMCS
jgi:uncharacterized membrane protein